ncbi:hypothetical protein [uncultured Pseudokineococcus sp.]|uniref:hypothetical protein n=1 Tax=uncultured Pseudokineococcus sp. TaxID=1642928 RepID=UPI002615773E|nr:hypothetical protein [uncultured Pseudokineococcus sp.]
MGAQGSGAVRGAVGGAAVVGLVVVPVLLEMPDLHLAAFLAVLAALGALLGSLRGAVAGHVVDHGGAWWRAAAVSGTAALVLVALVLPPLTDRSLVESWPIGLPVAGGALVVAVWQSWVLARRQDRAARRRSTTR